MTDVEALLFLSSCNTLTERCQTCQSRVPGDEVCSTIWRVPQSSAKHAVDGSVKKFYGAYEAKEPN